MLRFGLCKPPFESAMDPGTMDYFCDQVQQKDVGRRMQVGQEFLEYLNDPNASTDLEQDQQRLDKVIDEVTGWVNSSNYKVSLIMYDYVLEEICFHILGVALGLFVFLGVSLSSSSVGGNSCIHLKLVSLLTFLNVAKSCLVTLTIILQH